MQDKRDETTWIAIELTRAGEHKVEDGTLESSIRHALGVDPDFPIFVPATSYTRGDKTITIHLIEGYVFVASGLPEVKYFSLERQPYVNRVMSSNAGPHRMRVLHVLPKAHVDDMKAQMRHLVSSDLVQYEQVHVIDGQYKGLDGVLLDFDGDYGFVEIVLRSLNVIATIPRVFLESLE
jgi:transcription antitermination factor NusG